MFARHFGCGLFVSFAPTCAHTVAVAQALPEVNDPIPSQPVASALTEFSRQAGLQIVYMSRVADGVRSAAIPVDLSSDEALRRFLNATGLGFELLNKRTVKIAEEKTEGAKLRTTPAASPTSATRNTGYIRFAQADTSKALAAETKAPALSQAGRADAGTLEEIVVSGIRGSLRESLETKRDATALVDAITSEDIGKFPDKNVADSLQRIPGISVDRIWGECRDILYAAPTAP